MKVKRGTLLETLEKVRPGLAGKTEVIEQSQSFVFLGDRVVSYNDEIAVSAPLTSGIEGAVKGDELVKLLSKAKDEVLELEAGTGELLVKGKNLRAGIAMEAEISLPLEEIKPPEDFTPVPECFTEALRFCMFSASTDRSKPKLNCLRVKGRHVLSCDNYRLTRYDMGDKATKAFPDEVLIPVASVRELIGYKPEGYGISKGWIHFQTEGGVVFSCRVFEEDYPAVEQLLEVDGDSVEFPPNMKDMLTRAEIFAQGEASAESYIEVSIDGDKMLLTGRGDYGWLKEKARVKHGDGKAKFTIHPQFLSDVLDLLRTVEIGGNRMKMEGDNFIHVAALLVAQ